MAALSADIALLDARFTRSRRRQKEQSTMVLIQLCLPVFNMRKTVMQANEMGFVSCSEGAFKAR
jgi:hypothetical protein